MKTTKTGTARFVNFIHSFEKVIAVVTMIILGVIIVLSTIDLVINLIQKITEHRYFLFDIYELGHTLGIILTVIISIELFHTIEAFFVEDVIKIETVFLLAMVAIARDVIVLDMTELEGSKLVGIACVIAALCGGFFLIKRAVSNTHQEKQ